MSDECSNRVIEMYEKLTPEESSQVKSVLFNRGKNEQTYKNLDGALKCCHEDCYEQDKSFVEEEMADFRMRQEKGD